MNSPYFETGMKMRRTVLGDEHVDRNLAAAEADNFTAPLQDMLTELGWGAIWGRAGLPLKTRSLVTVGMLVALNRTHELQLHVRGAINNGCTREELREVLLHAGCYCGWPAAVSGFRAAKEILEQIEKENIDHT